jgi:hypothetical protein
MGITMKPVSEWGAKYGRRAPAAAPDYLAGVSNPSKDWATETAGAESSYNQGVQEAIGRSAFGKGVKEAGSGKWQEKARTLGGQRYAGGVTAGVGDYVKGVAPMADVLSRVSLSPKGPKGAAQNYQRVTQVGDALHSAKAK